MSIKYPWLPEVIASPLRRVRNSAVFRYNAWKTRPRYQQPTGEEHADALKTLGRLRIEKEHLVALRIDLEYALRSSHDLSQINAVLQWVYDNDNYRSRELRPAYNAKAPRPVTELNEMIHRFIREKTQ